MKSGFVLIGGVAMASASLSQISTTSPFFIDEDGRVRIFHGANRVQKGAPWYFENQHSSSTEQQLFKELGFNVIRLGYMWSGIEPEEGVYDQAYIDVNKEIVQSYNDHGVHVLLDLHEDILSSEFCLYDGAPKWLIDKSVPEHPFPWPLKGNGTEDCSRGWMENAFALAPQKAYQDIYDNEHGMLDSLAAMWAYSAEQWKDVSGVIGYEIMNEPFAGNTYKDPSLFLPGVAGKKNLQRMNDAVSAAIRAVDEKKIIFYEPVTWGMVFSGDKVEVAGSGFEHAPDGDSAFSFHYYCNSFGGKPEVCDKTVGPLVFKAVKDDVKKLGGAAMQTEGMACPDGGGSGGGGGGSMDECIFVQELNDKHLMSWTDYGSSQGAQWDLSEEQKSTWARTYGRAIAGIPTMMKFDIKSATKDFELCWSVDATIGKETEIFASKKYHYEEGVDVTVIGPVDQVESGDDDLFWFVNKAGATTGDEACVKLRRHTP